jgi:hypothetical protein
MARNDHAIVSSHNERKVDKPQNQTIKTSVSDIFLNVKFIVKKHFQIGGVYEL